MLLFTEKINDTRYQVNSIHYMPELLTEEQKVGGIEVDSIPEPDNSQGIPSLYINPITKELWYEYTAAPADDLQGLKLEIDQLKEQIAALLSK